MAEHDADTGPIGPGHRPGALPFAGIFLLVALVLLALIGSETEWVKRGAFFSQPRFWPAVGIGGMVFFGALHFVSAWRGRGSREDRAVEEAVQWLRSIEYALWFMAYVLVTPWAGYLPATIVFSVLLAIRVGYRSATMLWSAAGMGLAIVLVFKTLLEVKIPGGALYELLPHGLRNVMILYF